jgi:hypothetical protein
VVVSISQLLLDTPSAMPLAETSSPTSYSAISRPELLRAQLGVDRHNGSVRQLARQLEDHLLLGGHDRCSSTSRHSPSRATTSRTSSSGAEAPAVRPTSRRRRARPDRCRAALDQLAPACRSARRLRPGAASWRNWARRSPAPARSGRDRLDRRLAVGGGVADVLRLGADDLRIARLEGGDDLARYRPPTAWSGSGRRAASGAKVQRGDVLDRFHQVMRLPAPGRRCRSLRDGRGGR